jgi:ankyrin repeat protein
MAYVNKCLDAAFSGDLPRVRKMLADGDVRITDRDLGERTALLCAVNGARSLSTLKWLLEEGGACITERDYHGNTALHLAATWGNFTACQWLLEHGKADIAMANEAEQTVWPMLAGQLRFPHIVERVAEATALLRNMVVQGAPPGRFRGSTETTRAQAGGGGGGAAEGGPPRVPRAAAGPSGRSLPLDRASPCPGPRL